MAGEETGSPRKRQSQKAIRAQMPEVLLNAAQHAEPRVCWKSARYGEVGIEFSPSVNRAFYRQDFGSFPRANSRARKLWRSKALELGVVRVSVAQKQRESALEY